MDPITQMMASKLRHQDQETQTMPQSKAFQDGLQLVQTTRKLTSQILRQRNSSTSGRKSASSFSLLNLQPVAATFSPSPSTLASLMIWQRAVTAIGS
ncbi:hypothetical protein KC19_N009000, partial [Ceratodon purpureus]